ncbi:MAG: agmatinase [Candidatus Bathyarchaeia archaeon]
MSYRELFVSPSPVFSGSQRAYEEANYVILGVPLDVTSTYRSGARFAPLAIREASLNIETYSFRAGVDLGDLKLHDLGDVHVVADVDETLRRLELVTKDILSSDKMPVSIGGEHTITLGMMQGVGGNVAVVSFDAHLDLRNEYMGRSLSHTTFMRRLNEQIKPEQIVEIGTRAVCKEEVDYAKKAGIGFLTIQEIRKDGIKKTVKKINKFLNDSERAYLTIDMDVLDPAFAPAVQNPEPEGLHTDTFLDILCGVCNRVVAFDLVEVAPHYDQGITAIQAAKTIFETLCHIEKARKS